MYTSGKRVSDLLAFGYVAAGLVFVVIGVVLWCHAASFERAAGTVHGFSPMDSVEVEGLKRERRSFWDVPRYRVTFSYHAGDQSYDLSGFVYSIDAMSRRVVIVYPPNRPWDARIESVVERLLPPFLIGLGLLLLLIGFWAFRSRGRSRETPMHVSFLSSLGAQH
jgi:hypothetical protein